MISMFIDGFLCLPLHETVVRYCVGKLLLHVLADVAEVEGLLVLFGNMDFTEILKTYYPNNPSAKLTAFQLLLEELGCEAFLAAGHLLGGAGGEDGAATTAALGTHVDDVVGQLDDV